MTDLAPLLSSARMSWNTPKWILDLLVPLGRIGLDPCSNELSLVPAPTRWDEIADGLSRPWRMHGLVFVNPPYGRALPRWIDKAIAEADLGAEIVLLTPARPDTRWYDRVILGGATVGFLRGRVAFDGASAGAPFPSALLYLGNRHIAFRDAVGVRCTSFATRY